MRPESCPLDATAPRASGKLMPQRIAPGSITQIARIRSSWKLKEIEVEIEGLIGQNGSDALVAYAAHASAAQRPTWHQPRAMREDCAPPRASAAPRLLPMPRPTRNTARSSENV